MFCLSGNFWVQFNPNESDLFRAIPVQSEWIQARIDPNRSVHLDHFDPTSIQISDSLGLKTWFGFNRIYSDWSIGLIWNESDRFIAWQGLEKYYGMAWILSEWNSIRVNLMYSEPIRKSFWFLFDINRLKINFLNPGSIPGINPNESESIQAWIDANRFFNLDHFDPRSIPIDSNWKFGSN